MSQEVLVMLQGLGSPDPNIRGQCEKRYQEAKATRPDLLVQSLANALLGLGNEAATQQLCAVLLRRCLEDETETGGWSRLGAENQKKLRHDVLMATQVANSRLSRRAITHVIAQLARLSFDHHGNTDARAEWPEVFQIMFEASQCPSPERRENGFEMFDAVAEYAPAAVSQHSLVIGQVLAKGLQDAESVDVRLASLKALASLMVSLDIAQLDPFRAAVPLMLETLRGALDQAASTSDERLETISRDAIKALIDIVGKHPKFLRPDFGVLAQSMVAIVSAKKLDTATRGLGLEFLVTASESMPSVLRKDHPELAAELLPLAMRILCEETDSNIDMEVWEKTLDADGEDDDDNLLVSSAEAAMHRLATNLGGKTVLPRVFALAPALLADADWRRRWAAIQTLGLIGEGCGKRYYAKIKEVMRWALAVEKDPHPKVRYAVVHLIGRLALDFGDEDQCGEGKPTFQKKFASQALPSLSNFLRDPSARVATHAASSMVNFFSEFADLKGQDVAPYLDSTLEGLMQLITNGALTTKDEALSAVSAIAVVAGPELFGRYYDHLMPLALGVASNKNLGDNEAVSGLRGHALECAGHLASSVAKEKFAPHIAPTLELVLSACHQKDDTTLRNSGIAAAVRVASALGDDFIQFLPDLVPDLVRGCKEEFGLELISEDQVNEMKNQGYDILQFQVRGEGLKNVKVNSVAVQEIMACIYALHNFALQFKEKFAAFAPGVLGAVLPLIDADALQAVRNIAIVTLPHLVACVVQDPAVASDSFMVSFFGLLAKLKAEEIDNLGETEESELESSLETTLHIAESLCQLLQNCYKSNGAYDNDPYLGKRIEQHPPLYGFNSPERYNEGVRECAEALLRRVELIVEERVVFDMEKADHDESSLEKFQERIAKHYEVAERLVDACGYLIKLCAANPAAMIPSLREHLFRVVTTLSSQDAKEDILRLGLCLLDDVVEFLPPLPEERELRMRCLQICLATARGPDNPLARAAVWGLGVLAVYSGPELDDHVMDCARCLAECVESKRTIMASLKDDEEGEEAYFDLGLVVDNAVSALQKFCKHRGEAMAKRGLQPEQVVQRIVGMLPCTSDAEEAKVINVQVGQYVGTSALSQEHYIRLLIAQLAYGYDTANTRWDSEDSFLDERTRLELAKGLAENVYPVPSNLDEESTIMLGELQKWYIKMNTK